jgi:hypothetical protein
MENYERNRQLKAVLLNKGYGVTDVDGTYVEDFGTDAAKEVKEDSFFVVNLKDDPNFKDTITGLGEHLFLAAASNLTLLEQTTLTFLATAMKKRQASSLAAKKASL